MPTDQWAIVRACACAVCRGCADGQRTGWTHLDSSTGTFYACAARKLSEEFPAAFVDAEGLPIGRYVKPGGWR